MRHKILIVEDDEDFSRILEKRFTDHGFEVVLALDAFQATQAAHDDKPDVIILDLKLPGGGGATALKNLKLSVYTKCIPVIVSTGSCDDSLEKFIRDQGVSWYFKKPYPIEDMISKVKEILLV